jgi:hypothetical protein
MPTPTRAQLNKINKFSQVDLKEEQVYVFQSLSADTLPIKRFGWFGEYHIEMSDKMLDHLKKDYRTGVGLLASHNSNRLPFGRTFDAEVKVDTVSGEEVKTLYIDHYVVKYMEGEDGEKIPLRTEINGMTTQDIANHVDVGHTFDTSIGFSMNEVKCSICKHDLRDYDKCSHLPGMTYDVQVGENVEKQRCNIIADGGEGIENSLVYAGAVNRALIQNGRKTDSNENLSANTQDYDHSVKLGDSTLYNVDELKNLPQEAQVLCFLSKGNMQVFTNTNERRDFNKYQENKESEQMSDANKTAEVTMLSAEALKPVVSQELYDNLKLAHDSNADKLGKAETELASTVTKVVELQDELKAKDAQIEELSAKATLADEYRAGLIEETIKAGVAARGNGFGVERYSKYVATLSVADIKEELAGFKGEFPASVEAARVTAQEAEVEREAEVPATELSIGQIRQEAASAAMVEFQRNGGDLVELTEKHYSALKTKYGK